MINFSKLNPKLLEWLKSKGYLESSLSQEMAIPEIKKGNDVLITAPTGHGKTLAAVLPLFDKLLEEKNREEKRGIKMLYITPLKSLNRDILNRVINLATYVGLEVDLRHGDTTQKVRAQQLADPADVLISTPETLQAILTGKNFREILRTVRYVVIDEIHEICENKRGSQLSIALERLENLTGKPLQRIGLSATIGDADKISKFLTSRKCKIINAKSKKNYKINIDYPKPQPEDFKLAKELRTFPNVAYCMRRIKKLVEASKSTIIFVNTRETAESLGAKFKQWDKSFPIAVHHSSLSKNIRIDVEEKFRNGKLKAIISTSSLELGIDIGNVDLIIQYGSPRQATKLIQRVGRSGHGLKRTSNGEIICNSIDDYLEAYAILQKIEKGWLEEPTIPEKPLDVLAHQIVGICIDYQKEEKYPKIDDFYNIVKNAYPYRKLTIGELEAVIDLMKDVYLIWENDKGFYRTRKGLIYYFENLSTIPSEKRFFVIAEDSNRRIGVLHQGFVAQHIRRNAEFIMKGEPWKVVEIEGDKIKVVSGHNKEGAIPSWEGEMIPVPMEITELAGDLREKFDFKELKEQKENFVVPTSKNMYIEHFGDYLIIHSCFGSKVNQTLSKVIGAMISQKIGSSINVRNDAYRIIFKIPEMLGEENIIKVIKEIKPNWIESILLKSLKNSSMFSYEFYQVAKKFGAIEKDAEFSHYMVSRLINVYKDTPIYKETINELFRRKLDVEKTKIILAKIADGEIKLIESSGYEVSPLGAEGLDYRSISLIKPNNKIKEIYELIKKRLLKRKFWFACLRCGNEIGVYTPETIPENLKCPKCGAKLIGFIPAKERELARKTLKKHFNKSSLSLEELRLFKKFGETAELFINYGNRSVFVLAGYGIGPTTGKRILGRFHKTEEELIKDISKAERNFIETKMFW